MILKMNHSTQIRYEGVRVANAFGAAIGMVGAGIAVLMPSAFINQLAPGQPVTDVIRTCGYFVAVRGFPILIALVVLLKRGRADGLRPMLIVAGAVQVGDAAIWVHSGVVVNAISA